MGLDFVEVVLEVEDSFGIKIPDEVAGDIETVGQLYEFVLAARPSCETARGCLSSATFRMIRRAILQTPQRTSMRLRPRHSVSAVMPRSGRQQFWKRLQKELGLSFPRLVRPEWMVTCSEGATLSCAAIAGCIGLVTVGVGEAIAFAIATAIIIAAALLLVTMPFAVNPHKDFATFRGLTTTVVAYNYAALIERFHVSDRNDIWDSLCVILSDQLGIGRETLHQSTRFADMDF
jgi:hypothetical protein